MERISISGFMLAILCFITIEVACYGHTYINNYIRSEQEAMLDFKGGIKDPNNRLSSWKGIDYCRWQGIICENGTGFVVSIDLHNPYPRENIYEDWNSMSLSGEIKLSLEKLKFLKYLDLSFNSFQAQAIPEFLGSLDNLLYLNLSSAGFHGKVPSNLGNLSKLQHLDLSTNFIFEYYNYLYVEDIEWLMGLVALKYLGMDSVDLASTGSQWTSVLTRLPNLSELHFSGCNLTGSIPVGLGELPNLQSLDLSWNHIHGDISQLLSKSRKKLEFPKLKGNDLYGSIPSTIGNFCNLKYLDLSFNDLNGSLPQSIKGHETCDSRGVLPNLMKLYLDFNQLSGNLPNWLGEVKNLVVLDLFHNQLEGSIPSTIGNFCSLKYLDLGINRFDGSLPASIEGHETCSGKSFLPNLTELYMDFNQLRGKLPYWLGEVRNIKVLHLSSNQLEGLIPDSLWTLQHLEYLDLRFNDLNGNLPNSIGQLSQLQYFDVSSNHLSGNLPYGIGQLSQLQYLRVSYNHLSGSLSEQHFWNLSNLKTLSIGSNSFGLNVSLDWVPPFQIGDLEMGSCHLGPSFPTWLKSQRNLHSLDFSNASISSPIPNWFWTLQHLEHVDLKQNELNGSLANSIGLLSQLQWLDVSYNHLSGSLPDCIGQLSQLNFLDVSYNHLSGSLSEQHFWNLSKLEFLRMGSNSFHLNVSLDWIPPFQVRDLDMGSCHLGPSFPTWLQSQNNLFYSLNYSNASISSPIPNWFWNISFDLDYLDLSYNHLHGQLPNSLNFSYGTTSIDLSSNLLEGPIPSSNKGVYSLDLSHNKFSGPLPPTMGESMLNLTSLDLSSNQLTGTIPYSIGHLTSLRFISFSRNNLTGSIPNSIGHLTSLWFIQFTRNKLTGSIPNSIGHLTSLEVIDFSMNNLTGSIPSILNNCYGLLVIDLGNNNLYGEIPKFLGHLQLFQSLHLNHNKLSGELPSSFQNLTSLQVLDVSYNKLSCEVPGWIGFAFPNLVILNLRSNGFYGRLPSQIWNLSSLHVLDIAQNNLMGEIPATLAELKAMAHDNITIYDLHNESTSLYEERLIVTMKGQSLEYTRTLSLVIAIDLSYNNLSGRFPQGIAKLSGLVVLNLSRNHIIGQIPESISLLHQLSSLDLSSNQLSGAIPSSMAALTFLGYLNLSYNNFSGKIPFLGQMTTFNNLAFMRNPYLCGLPLATKCQYEDYNRKQLNVDDKIDGGCVDQWFYLSIGLGFATGILVPYFVLMVRKSWCEAYFDFVDGIVKWLWRARTYHTKNCQIRLQ